MTFESKQELTQALGYFLATFVEGDCTLRALFTMHLTFTILILTDRTEQTASFNIVIVTTR